MQYSKISWKDVIILKNGTREKISDETERLGVLKRFSILGFCNGYYLVRSESKCIERPLRVADVDWRDFEFD